MNFFEKQELAKKRTGRLVFYFILTIFSIILFIDILITGIIVFSNDPSLWELSTNIFSSQTSMSYSTEPKIDITFDSIFKIFVNVAIGISPIIIGVIFLGSLFRTFTLRSGGISVADMVKATPINLNTQDLSEKIFINVVEEMSIASGVGIPKLYVLKSELGINAFVAGVSPNDTVMVVTQGALNTLDRNELQSVIAHEYSHILNGDMKISMKLISLLAGILIISQIGYIIIRSIGRSSGSSGSSNKKGGSGAALMAVLGAGLLLIGYIGVFFGRLIKAGISREREKLADASSVQFTRNPIGLVGALLKIQANENGTVLNTGHAEEINHMCFCPSVNIWFKSLLASHPTLEERLNAIDPDGSQQHILEDYIKKHSEDRLKDKQEKANLSDPKSYNYQDLSILIGTMQIQNSIGHLSDQQMDYANQLIEQIPTSIRDACHSREDIATLYFALLGYNPEKPNAELFSISNEHDLQKEKTKEYYSEIKDMRSDKILTILRLSLPTFEQKNHDEKISLLNALLASCDRNNYFSYIFLCIISKSIDFSKNDNLMNKLNLISDAGFEINVLLIFVMTISQIEEETQKSELKNLGDKLALPQNITFQQSELKPELLIQSINKISLLPLTSKERIISACLDIIEEDQKITLEESTVIRGVGFCLDCPIPIIEPGAFHGNKE